MPRVLVSRFALHAGLVTFRQTFVLRCLSDAPAKRDLPALSRQRAGGRPRSATKSWLTATWLPATSSPPSIRRVRNPVYREPESTWAGRVALRENRARQHRPPSSRASELEKMISVRLDGRAASPPAGSSRVKEWPPANFTAFILQRKFGIEVHQRDGTEPRVVHWCRFRRRSRDGFHPEHKNFRQHCAAP